jgi:hypothetical protein
MEKTPSKFSQNRVYIMTKGFGNVEEGHGIAGDGIGNQISQVHHPSWQFMLEKNAH